jgi:hypothetical protein
MKKKLLTFVLVWFCAKLYAQQGQVDVVKKIEQTRLASLVTKDTATLNKIFAADVRFVNTLGETLNKEKVMLLIMEPDRKYTQASIDSFTSVDVNENTAVLITRTTLIRTLHNVISTLHNSQMAVYEKRRNKWQLVALHTTLIYPK